MALGETVLESQAQIVIVGGGIMGAGLLYHLAEEGCKDVLLIEKGELTSGSTWHAAGQVPSMVGNYNLAKIHAYSNELYPKLEELTGQYVSWHPSGGIRLALSQHDLDWFAYMKGIADNVGFNMEIIDPAKIHELNPFMDLEGVLAGAWTTDDGHADPAGLCNAMARGATNMGARIQKQTLVSDINILPSGEFEIVTDKGNIIAQTVVNAAGCFARQVAKMVGADLPICNVEHHYLVTGTVQAFVDRPDWEMPVTRDPRASSYLRQEQKSGLVGIYESVNITECWKPHGHPPWESDSELFPDDLDRLMPWLGHALERMPVLEEAGIKKIVNGAIAHSADGPPMLGPVAGVPNFWMCCGSSFGIAQGAGCGKYLAQWMVHGDAEINMTGFDPRRFGTYADDKYMRAKGFQDYGMTYATPVPGEELPAGRPRRISPLYDKLKSKGCVFTETFGWERPKWFSLDGREEDYSYRRTNTFDVIRDECMAVRERVGLLDLSGFAKYEVSGPDAEAYLNRICANRMPKKEGGITLTHILSHKGRIGAEMTITRLADDLWYVLSAAGAEMRDLDYLIQSQLEDESVEVANVTDDRGNLVLAGPRARDVLSKLTDDDLTNESFRWLTGKEITIGGIGVRTLRVNYVGELGWELHARMEHIDALYDALMGVGQEFGIVDFGLYAVNSLRIEKEYRGWGAELTNEVTMLDATMDRFIKFDKDDFVGKEATLNQGARSLQLIYFEVDAVDSDVRGGEPIFKGDDCVGVTTSGGYGHATGKSLGFGYVHPDDAALESGLAVDLLGIRCAITLLDGPVYDPTNEKIRA